MVTQEALNRLGDAVEREEEKAVQEKTLAERLIPAPSKPLTPALFRRWREELGLTQWQLAVYFGTNEHTVRRWENEKLAQHIAMRHPLMMRLAFRQLAKDLGRTDDLDTITVEAA